jgi:hypothetical protein
LLFESTARAPSVNAEPVKGALNVNWYGGCVIVETIQEELYFRDRQITHGAHGHRDRCALDDAGSIRGRSN